MLRLLTVVLAANSLLTRPGALVQPLELSNTSALVADGAWFRFQLRGLLQSRSVPEAPVQVRV